MDFVVKMLDVQIPGEKAPKRTHGYYLDFTDQEYNDVRAKSDETGIPVSVIIRSLLRAYLEAEPTGRLAETP